MTPHVQFSYMRRDTGLRDIEGYFTHELYAQFVNKHGTFQCFQTCDDRVYDGSLPIDGLFQYDGSLPI